jgi:subtilisin family serine protease
LKKIFSLLIALAFIAITAFAQKGGMEITGAVSSAAQLDAKICPDLSFVLSKTEELNNAAVSIPQIFIGNNSLIRIYKNDNGISVLRVFIKAIDIQGAENLVLSYGGKTGTIAGDIFTAEIPVTSIKDIALKNEISYMEVSRQAYASLDSSRSNIKVNLVQSGYNLSQAYKGDNVILGFVDTGIDWGHADFKASGTSRILNIWDMSGSGSTPSGYSYGKEYTQTQINASQCLEQDAEGHGTHVAGIAGGNGTASSGTYTGMAPNANIIFVKGERSNGSGFADADVVDGCNYIFTKAQALGKAAVINLSLGGQYGPHDGTSLYEQSLSNLTGAGKIIVAAAGNDGGNYIHSGYTTGGTSFSTGYQTLWQAAGTPTATQADLWYNTGSISVGVAAYTTGGTLIGYTNAVAPGSNSQQLFTVGGTTYGRVTINATNTHDSQNGDKEVLVTIDNVSGAYNLSNVYWSLYTFGTGTFDAWITQGGEFSTVSSGNIIPGNNNKSIGTPGTSNKVICVGAYTTKTLWPSIKGGYYQLVPVPTISAIASFSSIGPTRDGRIKPDFTAPGNIIASCLSSSVVLGSSGRDSSWVLPGAKYQMMSGTSMACPHAAGTIALLLQRNKTLDYSGVFNLITSHTTKDSYTGTTAGNVFGYGKLNAWNAISNLVSDIKEPGFAPGNYSLSQNYPNPFNPSTTIRYSIPFGGNVKLKVYDILGRETAVLVDEYKQTGNYEVEFSTIGKNISSGIYFYKLTAGNFSSAKKLVLLK